MPAGLFGVREIKGSVASLTLANNVAD